MLWLFTRLQGKKNLDKMLILTSGQVFHALKTVSLLVTASGIIGATKIRPNFKNNCNAQTKKKNHLAGKWRWCMWANQWTNQNLGYIETQRPGNGTHRYRVTGGSKMNNSSRTLHRAFDSETGAKLQASQPWPSHKVIHD